MEIRFDRPNEGIDELIEKLMNKVGVSHPRMIREMILTALKAGNENNYLADLKLMRTTMKEMRYTNKMFGPYRHRRKVTIFGSARTEPEEPIYQKCVLFSRLLAERGYMAITGGGGGIMQAGNEGSGADNSFAVNIHLPFEQETNPVMSESDNVITYRYFFNRKVAFLKEADALCLKMILFCSLGRRRSRCLYLSRIVSDTSTLSSIRKGGVWATLKILSLVTRISI